jgi:hypothetical protein
LWAWGLLVSFPDLQGIFVEEDTTWAALQSFEECGLFALLLLEEWLLESIDEDDLRDLVRMKRLDYFDDL